MIPHSTLKINKRKPRINAGSIYLHRRLIQSTYYSSVEFIHFIRPLLRKCTYTKVIGLPFWARILILDMCHATNVRKHLKPVKSRSCNTIVLETYDEAVAVAAGVVFGAKRNPSSKSRTACEHRVHAHCVLVLFNKIARNAYKFVRIISAVYWKFTSAAHIKSGTNLPWVGHRYMRARQCDFPPIMEIQILEQTETVTTSAVYVWRSHAGPRR